MLNDIHESILTNMQKKESNQIINCRHSSDQVTCLRTSERR